MHYKLMSTSEEKIDAWTGMIHVGDSVSVMSCMPSKSIHAVIFSPPYWALRNYGDGLVSVWGGDEGCEHDWGEEINLGPCNEHGDSSIFKGKDYGDAQAAAGGGNRGRFCKKCDAWEGQLGLEPKFDMYVANMVRVCAEVKRILRDDGSLWLNIGDTYSGGGGSVGHKSDTKNCGSKTSEYGAVDTSSITKVEDIQDKCKLLIPHRVAIALISDGWILRNDVVWYKPSRMPESVKDRLTKSFEFFFHFVKKKKYHYDLDAIRVPHKCYDGGESGSVGPVAKGTQDEFINANKKTSVAHPNGKNPGDVFEVNTASFPGKHFAVFPPELLEIPVKACVPQKVCAKCGKPYERIVEKHKVDLENGALKKMGVDEDGNYDGEGKEDESGMAENPSDVKRNILKSFGFQKDFVGWNKKCKCDTEETKPGIVLDPFMGSGTTGEVAENFSRRWIGIDISSEYAKMAMERINEGVSYIRKKATLERKVEKAKKENHSLFEFGGD